MLLLELDGGQHNEKKISETRFKKNRITPKRKGIKFYDFGIMMLMAILREFWRL